MRITLFPAQRGAPSPDGGYFNHRAPYLTPPLILLAYFAKRRNGSAAHAFFERAIDETGVRPERVTTDKAKCYPPALRAVLRGVDHRRSRYLNKGIECDHGHLKQRLRPMRGFKSASSADRLARGHGLMQNLRNGFSTLTQAIPRQLRLATAWPQLAAAI